MQWSKPRFSETFAFEAIVNFLRHCGKQCLISVLRVTREFCLVIVNQIKSFFISLNPSIVHPVKRDWAVLSKDTPLDISI